MEIQRLNSDLLAHLVAEFGDDGRRAVDFLLTAQELLSSDLRAAPRVPESVAYCLREAMKTIPASVEAPGGANWREVSRDVVEARQRYGLVAGLPGEDQQGALDDLLRSIDDMDLFHDQQGIHERRLIAVMVGRTGVVPLSAGTAPVRRYQELLRRLDGALHGECSAEESVELWGDCAAILRQLFLPPEMRHAELDALALADPPTNADLKVVLELVATPNHLQHFLTKIVSPVWLDLLAEARVIEPPEVQASWPGFSAVERLGSSHPQEVVAWLEHMYAKCGANPVRAWYLARAALDLGGADALAVVLRAVGDHQHETAILTLGLWAAERSDPNDELVDALADILLNEGSWSKLSYCEPLLEQLAKCTNAENARSRVKLLCFKLRSVPSDDPALRWLEWDPAGSIADREDDHRRDDRFGEILGCLVAVLRSAWSQIPAAELLDLIEGLAEPLERRLRPWLLAHSPAVDTSLMVEEIERAICTRHPTGDDIALLDRAVEASDPADYLTRWCDALGDPPRVDQVGRALGADDVPQAWKRALAWLSLLPEGVAEDWTTPCEVLTAAYGRPSRDALLHRARAEVGTGRSPYSREELLEREPPEAALLVSEWRPAPSDFLVGSRELARTLEEVVKADPAGWVSDPVSIATKLRHPTYINHYLRALADVSAGTDLPVEHVLDLVQLVTAHPWPAVQLGRHDFDYDADWRGAELSAVDLLKTLADADVDFEDRADDVWAVLRAATLQRSEPSGISADHALDPLNTAINRPRTRALQAVLSFMANEFRRGGSVRQEAVELIESSLRLDGLDGAEHRAILAPRLGFLRHVLPEWVEASAALLLGDEAPEALGQLTVDQAIKWSRPNAWLLENFRAMARDSVVREVDHALEHYLVAMLWECSGYSVTEVVTFVRSSGLVSDAGEALGRLLRHDDAELRHLELAVDFWRENIAGQSGASLQGFGWFSEVGLLDDELWAELTLGTLVASGGRIDWAHRVAERVVAGTPTVTGLAILNQLVRGLVDEWDRRGTADHAAAFLSSAPGLAETPEYERLRTTLLERGVIDS